MTAHSALESQIKKYLTYRGWLCISTHGSRNHPEEAGIPDLLCIIAGRVRAVEVKILPGKVSKAQERFHEVLRAHGAIVTVVNSLDDMMEEMP